MYVSASQVRRFALRKGDFVKGQTRPPASNEKYPALLRVDEINDMTPDAAAQPRRASRTSRRCSRTSSSSLELLDDPSLLTGRIVDLLSPIGKGQRGLIVSPPKVGKTTIMKQIVGAIERNNPEVHLMVLLVDERPEEVTDMKRHVQRGEVIASTFDRPSDEHTHVSELTIERAKRLVELGKDVTILLDGITRLARAYNLAAPASGRIMSGGIDAGALYPPKRFFGAARNVEEGGSLTIIATALVDTNSKMDEHIFEEFKGTGNWELKLDRKLAERRLFPAIDVNSSSTRHEELLFTRDQLAQVWKLRRVLNALAQEGSSAPGLELLIDKLRTTKSNDEFLAEIAKAPDPRAVTPATAREYRGVVGRTRTPFLDWTDHEDRHPPHVHRVQGALLVRQRVRDPLDRQRAPRGAVLGVPPLLHGQAEARGHRWSRRALQQAVREEEVAPRR